MTNRLQRQVSVNVKSLFVELNVETWQKDSHGLFDYETSSNISTKKFKIEGPCKIFRNWLTSETAILSNDDAKRGITLADDFHFLASLTIPKNGNNQTFILNAPERPTQPIIKADPHLPPEEQGPVNTNSYIVAKYSKSRDGRIKGHALEPGNTIKLGRMEYLVIECRTKDRTFTIRNTNLLGEKNAVHRVQEEFKGSCKICLGDESTPENFLLSPCRCKGSCELVHLDCLKMWIDSKMKKTAHGICSTYNFTKFECEICKEPFPKLVEKDGKNIEMIHIEKPNKPYIMFESLNERGEGKEEKNLHVICADEKVPIRLGRGHQCEIRMTDISVSRLHAEIKFRDNKFYIEDNNSKFGTLIKLDKKLEILTELHLQCGRSKYTFNLAMDSHPKNPAAIN